MTIAFDYYKTTLEFLKGNKVVLLLVTTALAGTGGITQTLRLDTAEKKAITSVREVAEGFQKAMAEIEKPATTPKIVTIKSECGECLKKIEKLNNDVKKLKRWH